MEPIISNKIRSIRKFNKLTQEEFAEELDISRSKVSNWERTKRDMTITDAIKLAKHFHLSLDNFQRGNIKEIYNEYKMTQIDSNQQK